jgi:hypothetical protein
VGVVRKALGSFTFDHLSKALDKINIKKSEFFQLQEARVWEMKQGPQ